ncbi:g8520 [Coccomyxa elongata]
MDRTELQSNLQEYRAQLQQVEQLLFEDPENAEYAEIHNNLSEAISLTEELLQGEGEDAGPSTSAAAQRPARPAPNVVLTEAPAIQLSSVLPATVAQQIRAAQQKAALAGQAPPAWAIGAKCHALSPLDGDWAEAVVKGISASGNFVVAFTGRESELEEVDRNSVKPPPAVEETYRGVAAPSRPRVNAEAEVAEMPKWLEIKPTDDDKTRAKKKKLQKSYKSKKRFLEMDMITKKKQQSWLDFKSGKGAKKKTGFLSTTKKGSIFSVPDGPAGKVGVVGSGKGMTENPTFVKHDYSSIGQ